MYRRKRYNSSAEKPTTSRFKFANFSERVSLSRTRRTASSPWLAGMIDTRKSMYRPLYRTRKRPSCGTRRSAMSKSLSTLMRESTMPRLGDGLHGVLQNTVDAIFNGDFRIARFDVNVAGAPLERRENNRFHQANHRARRAVPRQAVAGNGLFALLILLGGLQRECFRGLFQDALRLFRAFQQIADLPGGCNSDQELLA